MKTNIFTKILLHILISTKAIVKIPDTAKKVNNMITISKI